MSAAVGDVVLYTLCAEDLTRIHHQRHARIDSSYHGRWNHSSAGEAFPMVVSRVLGGGVVSGTVFLDGDDTLWASAPPGGGQGQWAPRP